jgi:Helicase associated domain
VPRTQEKTLSYWVQRQRMLNLQDKLKQYRKDMLDDLNFEWYLGINQLPDNYFDEMIGRLIAFKEGEGHVDVPRRYKRGGLGDWVEEMKAKGRDGLLEPGEAERLLRVGFTWMEDRESWLRQYEECAYELKNCRRYETMVELSSENENWLQVQFLLLDYDMLPSKRREKLESLGVEWDGKEFSWEERGIHYGGGADHGMYDDEISTGFDLKDAAMAWTPDGKAGSHATEKEREASSALPSVAANPPETPVKAKEDVGKVDATTEKSSKQDKESEEAPAAVTSATVVEREEAPAGTLEGKKHESTDGASDKNDEPPLKKAKTEASDDK